MGQPLVSVIIPTYNGAPWIASTLASVFAQTYTPLEIVVIDDGSTDSTRSLLASYGDRIRLILNEKNIGVSASRNKAIDAAQGDYIALLDHDDLWEEDKIALQMKLFEEQPELGLVYSDALCSTEQGHSWRYNEIRPPHSGLVLSELLQDNFITCTTAVIKKSIFQEVGGFRTDLRMVEDYDLFLKIAEKHPIDYVETPEATYRIHESNFSHKKDILFRELIDLYLPYTDIHPLSGRLAYFQLRLAVWEFLEGQWLSALRHTCEGVWGAAIAPFQFSQSIAYFSGVRTRLRQAH